MEQIYILKLRAGKYYIGKTKNIEKRYEEHLTGTGSGWTKKHKPVSLIKTIKSTSQFDEDKYVKEYMAKYGIENVRGGSYSNIVLDENSIAVLEKEIRHSNNVCMRCGRDTHYIKDCYATTDVDGAIISVSEDDKKEEPVVRKAKTTKKKKHWSSDECDSDNYCYDNVKTASVPITPIKTANNKGITPKTTIFKVSNNNGNEIIEFSNIRDYGRWAETDIAQRGSWKIEVS
jgi:predicted GIY-YIG superfamily endonuclease